MDNEKKRYLGLFGLGLTALVLLSIFTIGAWTPDNQMQVPNEGVGAEGTVRYSANVCTTLERANGTLQDLGCSHNLLYSAGAEHIERLLGGTTTTNEAALVIAMCNATAGCGTPVAAASEAFNQYTNCGLTAAAGSYSSLGTGNWSVYKQFTSTCNNILTNSTRLQTAAGLNFSGNTFTLVTLQTNDKIGINWTISVS